MTLTECATIGNMSDGSVPTDQVQQSLVVSKVLEHGKLIDAADEVGVPHLQVVEWYRNNANGFADRVQAAQAVMGHQLDAMMFEKVMSGEVKNPSIISLMLSKWLPEKYAKDEEAVKTVAADLMRQLRSIMARGELPPTVEEPTIDVTVEGARELPGLPAPIEDNPPSGAEIRRMMQAQ